MLIRNLKVEPHALTIPTLPLYAKRFGTTMVSTHEVIRMPDTQVVEFKPEEMRTQAEKILGMANKPV